MVLRMWGSETRKFGLSSELIMKIDHRTEIEKKKLMFRVLALTKGQRSKRQLF